MPVLFDNRIRAALGRLSIWSAALSLTAAFAACSFSPPVPTPAATIPAPTPTVAATAIGTPTLAPTLPPASTATARPPEPPPAQTPTPGGAGGVLASPEPADDAPPDRDLFEITLRLKYPGEHGIQRVVNDAPVSYEEGRHDRFFVTDLFSNTAHEIDATLMVVTENAYWYVDDSLTLPEDRLRFAASEYESKVLPSLLANFGDVWNPGVDNDRHLTILNTTLRGAAGYYGSTDEFPRAIHPKSNEREIIYMHGPMIERNMDNYLGVVAHELQHAVHWNLDSGEESWLNEGMSEVAKSLAGYPASFIGSFLARPDTQLNYWPDSPGATAPHYGAATLYLMYLAEHYGGYERLGDLAREQADGTAGVDAYLAQYGTDFRTVFKDWVVANYLNTGDGAYAYADRDVKVRDVETVDDYAEFSGLLPQFSARYFELDLPEGGALLSFDGSETADLFQTRCFSGNRCWWGNQGDTIDSRLTREIDLSDLESATLEYMVWFDIEEGWDYAYVMASPDGGATWNLLEGVHTTTDNPVGNAFGPGYTGESGVWVQERIDLTPFTGGKVLLRFEYVTDDAIHNDGFVVDDIAVPELGWSDDAETDGGWHAEGFRRTDNVLPQEFFVQIAEVDDSGAVSVRSLSLGPDRSGETVIETTGSSASETVVIVSPSTLGTHQPSWFTLSFQPVP